MCTEGVCIQGNTDDMQYAPGEKKKEKKKTRGDKDIDIQSPSFPLTLLPPSSTTSVTLQSDAAD